MQPFDTRRRFFIISATAAACLQRPAAAARPAGVKPLPRPRLMQSRDGRFVHDAALDLTGYFYPQKDIQAGTFKLDQFAFGEPKDFEVFEKKGQTIPTWTPLCAEFEDMSSAEKQGELGPYRANSPRVLCSRYVVTRDRIEFLGHDRQVGYVRFVGRAGAAFLASQASPETATEATDAVAMTGDVFIGTRVFRNATFGYWTGD